jgi:hypothetical protein
MTSLEIMPQAFFGAVFFSMIFIFIVIYVYYAITLMTIGKKLKYKRPWLAWIPFANIAMIFQLGGFHWAWVFLILIPIAGIIAVYVLSIISFWKIYEARNYPGALALINIASFVPFFGPVAIIANMVVLGIVAWKDK